LQKGDLQPEIAFFTFARIFPDPSFLAPSFRPERSEASVVEEPAFSPPLRKSYEHARKPQSGARMQPMA
jgi:hypothetical protein